MTPIEQIFSLTIDGLGSSGEGVGHADGYTIFIDGALPGEKVKARMIRRHKRYGRARLVEIENPSPARVTPPCPLFGRCGGCQLMHLAYDEQLHIKQQRVLDAMQRIGKLEKCPVNPCVPSPSPLAYRNKIQLPTQKGKKGIAFGLYARSSHQLVEVDHCYIHCALGEEVFSAARKIVEHHGITPYCSKTGQGELRHLLIKSAIHTGQALVVFVTNQPPSSQISVVAEEILTLHPAIKGVIHNFQPELSNVILGNTYTTLAGKGFIQETLGGFTFKVSPASFFQVNPDQAEQLYKKALEYADLKGDETLLDAYCGVGTLSLFFAPKVKHVTGVEYVSEAIEDARENAAINGITNADFVCADTEFWLKSLSAIDIILLNPPRKGCAPAVLEEVYRLSPKKIIYISCDPATLARDLALLSEFGYHLQVIQPFDMFPQTAHVECVAYLVK